MPGAPFSDRAVSLALAQRMSQADVTKADDPHRGRLDHRHTVPGGIDDRLPQAGRGQGLTLMLVICHQPGRGGLGATENRRDRPVTQRPGQQPQLLIEGEEARPAG